MVDAIVDLLAEMNIQENQIKKEYFPGYDWYRTKENPQQIEQKQPKVRINTHDIGLQDSYSTEYNRANYSVSDTSKLYNSGEEEEPKDALCGHEDYSSNPDPSNPWHNVACHEQI